MKNITSHEGILEVMRRLPSSVNGNPRFELRVAGFTCRTAPDAMLAYGVQNADGKRVKARIGTHYGFATLDSYKIIEPITPGSISHGTLRSDDLARALLPYAVKYLPERFAASLHAIIADPDSDPDGASEDIADTIDALEPYAAPGHYIGMHVGDGSDLGCWPIDSDD